jgi:transposase-like protein
LEAARSRFQVDWTEGTYEPPKTYRGSVARKKREEARAAREKEMEGFRNRPRNFLCEECGKTLPRKLSERTPEECAREAADLAEAHAQIGKILAALGVPEDQQKELSKKARI